MRIISKNEEEKYSEKRKAEREMTEMAERTEMDYTEFEDRLRAEGMAGYQRIPVPEEMERRLRGTIGRARKAKGLRMTTGAVAAAAALVVMLPNAGADIAYAMGSIPVVGKLFQAVTFRDYQYESDRFSASVEVPQIVVGDIAQPGGSRDGSAVPGGLGAPDASGVSGGVGASGISDGVGGADAAGISDGAEGADAAGISGGADGTDVSGISGGADSTASGISGGAGSAGVSGISGGSEVLDETIRQVNFDIEKVTGELVAEFEEAVQQGESYSGLEIHHDVVTDNEKYFSLRLFIYQAAGSGTQSYKIYTIDKQSGLQVSLGGLFGGDSGCLEKLSDNIREQMRAAMAADEMKAYWVDKVDIPALNWQGLKEDQNFYFDGEGNLVIAFDEYEVAPGYMGAQEFTVEKEVFEELLK